MSRRILPRAVTCCVASLPTVFAPLAFAGFLHHTVRLEQIYPTMGAIPWSAGDAVVGPDVEYPFPGFEWDIADTEIRLAMPCIILQLCHPNYTPSPFNGWRISDLDGSVPSIV